MTTTALAQDVAAAAQAYEAGQRAQLAGNHGEAARLFELAFDAAPSPQALRSAIRNRRLAGDDARAATLALEAILTYPGDRDTRNLSQEVLDATQPQLTQLEVACGQPCVVLIDGAVESPRERTTWRLFVRPGAHSVSARYASGRAPEQQITAEAGTSRALSFEPPAAPAPTPEPQPEPVSEPLDSPVEPPPAEPEGRDGLAPAVFWSSAAVTAVVAGVTAWSVADTFAANRDYEDNPTREGYLDGQDRRRRTFALVGVSGALAVTTVVLGALTDFGGADDDDDDRARASVWASPDGAGVVVQGGF